MLCYDKKLIYNVIKFSEYFLKKFISHSSRCLKVGIHLSTAGFADKRVNTTPENKIIKNVILLGFNQ